MTEIKRLRETAAYIREAAHRADSNADFNRELDMARDLDRKADVLETCPAVDSEWTHKNGNTYKVIIVANLASSKDRLLDYPPTVVYRNHLKTHEVWTRTLDSWLSAMTPL